MRWFQQVDKDIMTLFTELFLALLATLFFFLAMFFMNIILVVIGFYLIIITYTLVAIDIATYHLYSVKKYIEENPEKAKIIFWIIILIIFSPVLTLIINWTGIAAIYGGLFIVTVANEIRKNYQKSKKKKKGEKIAKAFAEAIAKTHIIKKETPIERRVRELKERMK